MPAELHLSKLDVALRQLETAITLYFHYADPISIHTLTAAAYNVLRNIKTHRGVDFTMLKDAEQVYPHMRDKFRSVLNEAENFFKHADRDPDDTIAFAPGRKLIISTKNTKRPTAYSTLGKYYREHPINADKP